MACSLQNKSILLPYLPRGKRARGATLAALWIAVAIGHPYHPPHRPMPHSVSFLTLIVLGPLVARVIA